MRVFRLCWFSTPPVVPKGSTRPPSAVAEIDASRKEREVGVPGTQPSPERRPEMDSCHGSLCMQMKCAALVANAPGEPHSRQIDTHFGTRYNPPTFAFCMQSPDGRHAAGVVMKSARVGSEPWDRGFEVGASAALPVAPSPQKIESFPAPDSTADGARGGLKVISRLPARRSAVANIDLKLLAIISELHRTRSVSHAAENLQLSQSTISMSLAKLRRHFNDPLFVRTSTGMEPTTHALEVLSLLRKAEGLIQSALEHHVIFDPSTSDRVFRLCSTDIAQFTLLPALMAKMKEVAPAIQVDLVNVSDEMPRLLESGEIDLAVGFIPPLGAGFYQQRLFRDRFVCAVRAGHPRVRSELSLERFQQEIHLTVATSGTGHGIVERTLEAKRIRRRIGLRVPSFLGLAPILTSTDFVAIVPEQLGRFFVGIAKIRLLPLPFNIPPYYILQHWHERYNHDPANVWFRGVLAERFLQ
jgi:DNA-binding transcriptional LysR family regulator